MNRKHLTIGVIALQVLFFVGWYMAESGAMGAPIATIKVKPEPYDPRDLLSGQYFNINYEFSRTTGRWNAEMKRTEPREWAGKIVCTNTKQKPCRNPYGLKQDGDVWVTLEKGQDGFYHPITASFHKPERTTANTVAIRGSGTTNASNILYGIERYFVPEGTRDPNAADTSILLDVYTDGKVRINSVLVKGEPWP
jgi:uncharacterized membrane-anchored protein